VRPVAAHVCAGGRRAHAHTSSVHQFSSPAPQDDQWRRRTRHTAHEDPHRRAALSTGGAAEGEWTSPLHGGSWLRPSARARNTHASPTPSTHRRPQIPYHGGLLQLNQDNVEHIMRLADAMVVRVPLLLLVSVAHSCTSSHVLHPRS
jgi:hypothetical protein